MKPYSCGDALTEHGVVGVEMVLESPELGLLGPPLPLTNSGVAAVPVWEELALSELRAPVSLSTSAGKTDSTMHISK